LHYNQNLQFFVPKAKPFSRFREHSPIKSWCIPLLTNTTERYMRGGDAALCQITSTTCILRTNMADIKRNASVRVVVVVTERK